MGTFTIGILFATGTRLVSASCTQKEKRKNHKFFHKKLLRWFNKGIN